MSNYHIQSYEHYQKACFEAKANPELFWNDIAKDHFIWRKPWINVLKYDFSKPEVAWFEGGQLNITENCIDRHLPHRAQQTAIIFEPNDPKLPAKQISYLELHQRVCKFANVLKSKGIVKGDRVCLYLPMIPELAIAVLACARIGAVHSVVFAGFSSTALATRIKDCDARMVITSDGAFRGNKTLDLKSIVDRALEDCPNVSCVLLVGRTNSPINMVKDRDVWIGPELEKASYDCPIVVMDAEDPLFILYTSGSTGQPKGMMHTTGGYMVYTAYTFKNYFQYVDGDVYWCTADIGWITGHSYIVYGPLLNGATTVMFEGVPSHPDYGRFWEIIEKHKVTQFYTAPTAIRALAKQPLSFIKPYNLNSLKVLGTVGEPINEEAWQWYYEHIGKGKVPIIDTWWQTETGGIMIANIPRIIKEIPTFATKPMPGIQPILKDEKGATLDGAAEGSLCIEFPWPSMARTIWGNHDRFRDTYFSSFEGCYFTGDGAVRDVNGNYRITGRVDDVIIVSGHNLGTAPIEDAINEHPTIAESAVIGRPHNIKGQSLCAFVIPKQDGINDSEDILQSVNALISKDIGPIAKLDRVFVVSGLPKTRSGKIMRRILRKIASEDTSNLGDTSTLLNPEIVQEIIVQFNQSK